MRRAARVDANQPEIIAALRKAGATVQPLHSVGQGCPDLLIGYAGKCFTVEVKDGAKLPSARSLTVAQIAWHEAWRGQVAIAESAIDALRIIGAVK